MHSKYLLVSVGTRACAFPLADVSETMRPLSMVLLPDVPDFIAGVARVRGELTMVVDARPLLAEVPAVAHRMIMVKAGSRKFGFIVDEVVGIVELDDETDADFASMLPSITPSYVDKLLKLESSLATVLNSARIVPESAWQSLLGLEKHG